MNTLGRSCLLTALCLLAPVYADNWPQWRGPTNNGLCNEKGLPTTWSADKNVVWKFKLPGAGASTPAIWGDRIFLTAEAGKEVVLFCVGTDGKEKWKKPMGTAGRAARTDEGNGASPSPSTDGKHVFAFVGNGTFAAFDFDGKEVWKFDAQKRYGAFKIQFGLHSTPVLHAGKIYQQYIHSGGAWVVCIDAKTGEDVWKVKRPSDGTDENEHSYASAFLWSNGKDEYLVCHGNDYATAHSLKDGSEIWRVGDLNPEATYNKYLRFVASPACSPDLIVIPTAKNGPVVGLKPDAKGKITKGNASEQWRMDRGTPDVPSAVIAEGLVYLCRENGEIVCLDAKTGKQHYRKGTHNHRHRASPVLADGKLYLTSRDGTISVLKAGTEFELLSKNKLPDQTAASPAVSGGRIYVRGYEYLWAIGEK